MAGKSLRGFGAMDREKQRQIASKGGKAAHQKGTAHEFTPEEARAAGRKGGQAAHQKGTAHQFTPQEAAAAGRKGGRAAHQRHNGRSLEGQSTSSGTAAPTSNGSAGGNETMTSSAGQQGMTGAPATIPTGNTGTTNPIAERTGPEAQGPAMTANQGANV